MLIPVSVLLFAAGTVAAFAFVSPALHLFLYLGGPHIVLVPRAADYLSFLLLLVVSFGVTFEYPLFLLGLVFARRHHQRHPAQASPARVVPF